MLELGARSTPLLGPPKVTADLADSSKQSLMLSSYSLEASLHLGQLLPQGLQLCSLLYQISEKPGGGSLSFQLLVSLSFELTLKGVDLLLSIVVLFAGLVALIAGHVVLRA